MSNKIKGSLLLVLAAMIWGSSFIVMKSAVDFLTPNVLLPSFAVKIIYPQL